MKVLKQHLDDVSGGGSECRRAVNDAIGSTLTAAAMCAAAEATTLGVVNCGNSVSNALTAIERAAQDCGAQSDSAKGTAPPGGPASGAAAGGAAASGSSASSGYGSVCEDPFARDLE